MNNESIVDANGTEEGEILDEEDAHVVVIVQESSYSNRGKPSPDENAPTPRDCKRRRLGPVKAIQFEGNGLNVQIPFYDTTSTSQPHERGYAHRLYTSFTSDDVLDHLHEQVEALQLENHQLRYWNSELIRVRDHDIGAIQRIKTHYAEEVQFLESENQSRAALVARDSIFAEQAANEAVVLRAQNMNLQNEKAKLEAELEKERKHAKEAASLKEKLAAEQSRAIAMEVEVHVREQQVDELKKELSKAYEQLRRYKLMQDTEFLDMLSSGRVTIRQEAEPSRLQDDDVVDVKPDNQFI